METSHSTAEVTVKDIKHQLMNEIKQTVKKNGKITDEVLSALQFVHQSPLLPSLELIDNDSVSLLQSPSGRQIYQVMGSAGTKYYTCFTSSNFCSCQAYRFSVLKKEDHEMCKHMLAVELSKTLDLLKKTEISDNEMAAIIQEVE